MSTLIEWLKLRENKYIEPRDLDGYLAAHPELKSTVDTPDAAGITPLMFVAGQGEGDKANILISRYGAKKSKAALDAYNAFVLENPDENDAETQAWMRKMIGGRRKKTKNQTRKGRRVPNRTRKNTRKRAF
jgi:hypothetical protein